MISLIVATYGRSRELRAFFQSLVAMDCRVTSFEVIVVDQNQDALIDGICREFATILDLKHEKVTAKGVSKARNHGALFATGEIIAFPDDDCLYPEDLLTRVEEFFHRHPEKDMLFARGIDKITQKNAVIRFKTRHTQVTKWNVYCTTVEFTMFIRRRVWLEIGGFDESFGLGTPFSAEEGADFVFRALSSSMQGMYDPTLIVYHPIKVGRFDIIEHDRAWKYGMGLGRFTAKHLLGYGDIHAPLIFAYFQYRACGGMLLGLLTLNPNRMKYYALLFAARSRGLFVSIPDYLGRKIPLHPNQ